MSTSNVDLTVLARRLADRRTGRTEANVQSDLHMLLTAAPLQLQPTVDGGWRIPPMPADTDIAARRRLWAEWSDRAWAWWDDSIPARFSTLLSHRIETPGAAA